MNFLRSAILILACAFLVANAAGQDAVRSRADFGDMEARFARGSWSIENVAGAYFLFDRAGNDRPVMDIAINSLRVGYMFNDPTFSGAFRGNVQVLAEVFGGPIFSGPGDIVAGGTLFLRYNFVQPNARIVPYLQGGAGLVYSDYAQGAEGGNAVSLDVNFNLQATAGLRFNVNSKWSVLVEGGYRHISNASLSDPNYGIDQVGGSVGFAVSF
jgi:opacity protein-like surface antigen